MSESKVRCEAAVPPGHPHVACVRPYGHDGDHSAEHRWADLFGAAPGIDLTGEGPSSDVCRELRRLAGWCDEHGTSPTTAELRAIASMGDQGGEKNVVRLRVREVEVDLLERMAASLKRQDDLNGRLAAELERLGKGIERIAAKYGADHPEVADALHRLLRGRP